MDFLPEHPEVLEDGFSEEDACSNSDAFSELSDNSCDAVAGLDDPAVPIHVLSLEEVSYDRNLKVVTSKTGPSSAPEKKLYEAPLSGSNEKKKRNPEEQTTQRGMKDGERVVRRDQRRGPDRQASHVIRETERNRVKNRDKPLISAVQNNTCRDTNARAEIAYQNLMQRQQLADFAISPELVVEKPRRPKKKNSEKTRSQQSLKLAGSSAISEPGGTGLRASAPAFVPPTFLRADAPSFVPSFPMI